MVYNMRLNDSPFNKIKSGVKTVELRLFDSTVRALNIGDSIIFTNIANDDEHIAVKIKVLYRYASFKELFEEISLGKCGNSPDESLDDVINRLRRYYPEKEEQHYGVVGIKVELANLQQTLDEEDKMTQLEFLRSYDQEISGRRGTLDFKGECINSRGDVHGYYD